METIHPAVIVWQEFMNNKRDEDVLVMKEAASGLSAISNIADLIRGFDIAHLQPVLKKPSVRPQMFDPNFLELAGTRIGPMALMKSLMSKGKVDPFEAFNLITKQIGKT
jgi:hypothetical protein